MNYPIELSLFDNDKELFLPVQALMGQSIEYVLSISSVFEDIQIEINTNDLSNYIVFLEETNGQLTSGEIIKEGDKYIIRISYTFCQFMWSVGLYMITYFDNVIHIPTMNAIGTNIHGYKVNRYALEFANDTFFRARRLQEPNWKRDTFFELPNICDPQIFQQEIGRANAVMIGGVAFIFAHELSHNFLGHTHIEPDPKQIIREEVDADNTALSYIAETFASEQGYANKVGIANLLCSLLLLGKDSVGGGGSHPHMDIRIEYMMNSLNLSEMDSLYGYVGTSIRMWLLVYGGYTIEEDMALPPFSDYKAFYHFYLRKLKETREKLFPNIVPPAWYVE